MPQSITFDSTELRNTTYIPRFIKHESATERELNILNLARSDGGVLVNDRRGVKRITLQGVLTGTSESNLETNIDSFKELLSRQRKNLDISWAGSTRRYVATCASHNFDRDFFHLLFVPWTAEFIVESGVGSDTTITAEKNAVSVNTNPYTWKSTFAGSAKPKPIITFEVGAGGTGWTTPRGLEITNVDNGQKIIFIKSSVIAGGDTIVFDWENKKVTLEGVEQNFYGLFPDLIVGDNNFSLQVGDIVDQYSNDITGYSEEDSIFDTLFSAQNIFVPYTEGSYKKIKVFGGKTGTPPADLRVEIQTDDNGEPSGSLVDADAYGTIAEASISSSMAWLEFTLQDNIQLSANTPYWIVLKTTGGNSSNRYRIGIISGTSATYRKGFISTTEDSGTTWVAESDKNIAFELLFGGAEEANPGIMTLDVDYYKLYL